MARVTPNLEDYDRARRTFSWDQARAELHGSRSGVNIADLAVVRHAEGRRRDTTALRWLGRSGDRHDITYGDLEQRTARFANVLGALGHGPGVRVATLAGRIPELYVSVLGALRAGGVVCPLFPAFGPDPIRQRLSLGSIDVVATTPSQYERKIAPMRSALPALRTVLLCGGPGSGPGVQDLDELMAATSDRFDTVATGADDPALIHFTSGTTGTPKGALHVHGAVVAHHISGQMALDLRGGDVFWCTADPGWVTGMSYGIVSPLTNGVTSVVDEGDFDADRWYRTIQDERVDVWYTAPTALRMLMRIGADAAREYDLGSLRLVASVGEPLNPEVVRWAQGTYGVPILDNWWQSETGGIMIANYRSMPVKPGSMGKPLPGVDATILERDDEGELTTDDEGHPAEVPNDQVGELALRRGWPSMFRNYLGAEDRYAGSFAGDWYRTGDLARRDADGYYWFVGRGDDVIKSAGHLIGPFEVESVLIEHPAVSEAAIIGKPDPTAGQVIKAFVRLAPGIEPGPEVIADIIAFSRRHLGTVAAPREVELVDQLPRTRSGKIMRRLLKARELGLPEGDLSTLESGA